MSKKKEKDGAEFWRGKWRSADKENRALRRRIKELEKREHFYEPQDEEIANDNEDSFPKLKRICPECAKGELRVFDIIGRIYEECLICDYRKKIK